MNKQNKPNLWELDQLEILAASGDLDACVLLAYELQNSDHPNEEKITTLLKKASDGGNSEGAWHLARFLYYNGSAESMDIANKIAKEGDFRGNYLIGMAAFNNKFMITEGIEYAINILKPACVAGHIPSLILRDKALIRNNPLNLFNYIRIIFHGIKFVFAYTRDSKSVITDY